MACDGSDRLDDLQSLRAFGPVLVLLAFCFLINYVDRGNLSIAAPLLKDELGISASQLGILLAAFFWTYTAMQFVSGWLVDRFDVNWVIAAGYLLWSLATVTTGIVSGFTTLLAMRLLLGIGESVGTPTGLVNAAPGRVHNTTVWTRSEMIVWGGVDETFHDCNTGGRYNPSTDSWVATSLNNAPSPRDSHTAVWTGAEMIVWGGVFCCPVIDFNTGGRYNARTDSWTATSTANAPFARANHSAVWTGSEMIAWGGFNYELQVYFNTGGRYCAQSGPTPTLTPTSTPTASRGQIAGGRLALSSSLAQKAVQFFAAEKKMAQRTIRAQQAPAY